MTHAPVLQRRASKRSPREPLPIGPRSGSSTCWRRRWRWASPRSSSPRRSRSCILDVTMTARRRARAGARAVAAEAWARARDGPRGRALQPRWRRRRTTSSSKAAARTRSRSSLAATSTAPYWWEVRLFKPGVIDEVTVRLRPDGAPDRLLAAHARSVRARPRHPGARRPTPPARSPRHARKADWGVDLHPLQAARPIAADAGERPRRPRVRLRAARGASAKRDVRLALDGRRGDELTDVVPYVHVPERFGRRFAELRSANNAIASASLA